jgi:hypothetical protein
MEGAGMENNSSLFNFMVCHYSHMVEDLEGQPSEYSELTREQFQAKFDEIPVEVWLRELFDCRHLDCAEYEVDEAVSKELSDLWGLGLIDTLWDELASFSLPSDQRLPRRAGEADSDRNEGSGETAAVASVLR